MIEQGQRPGMSQAADLETLQRRANRQRARHQRTVQPIEWHKVSSLVKPSVLSVTRIPARLLLHVVVALVLPAAMLLSQLPPGAVVPMQNAMQSNESNADIVVPLAPLALTANNDVGDDPLPDDADIPTPLSLISLSEALAPVVVPATVIGDRVNLRGGPGTDYDVVDHLASDQNLQVIGRFGDWFQVREQADKPPMWISGELLNISDAAASTLFEVQQKDIPPPPPPKVGLVNEDGLILRDGPGTNYVPITTLQNSAKVDLIEIYQDWYHIGIQGGADGWVKGSFLTIDPSIVSRLLVADAIPDPNPDLVGVLSENNINLRKGPDSRYARVGTINAGVKVDLVGKFKDWVKVRLPDGTKAWIFGDLLNSTAHVMRRVPVSKDFPPLPVTVRLRANGNSPNLAGISASGDVASFAVQFVGYRYRWGGTNPGRGFDCSGLTSYVYRQHGVSLPRTASSQYSTSVGARVGSMDSLAPGDLVFFSNTGGHRGISHVGIYIGGGRIVHAMTPRYGVQISSIYDRYWTSHFVGGIRPRR